MAAVEKPKPYPPGQYDVAVVGSGPGGIQTSYCLARLGIDHALLSADDEPAGMFRRWPIFERLISWSKADAPAPRDSVEYERYDHNSLVAEEPGQRALVPAAMGRESVFPTRAEMEAGLRAFQERAGVRVRYGCRWESTAARDGGFALATSDGEYRCRSVVFAIGTTEPWKPALTGIEDVPHYAQVGSASDFADRTVVLIGKRNSAFELADGLLPWARRIVLVSPRAAQIDVLAHATVRPRYFQPLEEHQIGGGAFAVDAAVERVERGSGGYRVHLSGTTWPGSLVLDADAVIAATGFGTPLRDLPELGLATLLGGRMPALNPYWESISLPGVFFAGNATVGAPGLRKHGAGSASTSVRGFRYNARVLARHLAERLGRAEPEARPLAADGVAAFLTRQFRECSELWGQKAYLARVVALGGGGRAFDRGVHPLWHFVDEPGGDAVAVTIETDRNGVTFPSVYVRRGGRLSERPLDPHPLNDFTGEEYERAVAALVQ